MLPIDGVVKYNWPITQFLLIELLKPSSVGYRSFYCTKTTKLSKKNLQELYCRFKTKHNFNAILINSNFK
jgi:hypothetical protein